MLLKFDRFFRERGLRFSNGLMTTKVWPVRQLPRDSVLHHLDLSTGPFPDPSYPFIALSERRVLLQNFHTLPEGHHSTGRKIVQLQNLVSDFVRRNKKFVNFLKDIVDADEEQQLVVVNYNLTSSIYRYPETAKMTPWFMYADKANMLWSHVNELCFKSPRNHFIHFNIPEGLPSRAKLNMYKDKVDTEILKYFPDDASKMLLDFWRWLRPETRQHSSMKHLDLKNLSKVNLVFQVRDGRSTFLNLAYVYNWIDQGKDEEGKPLLPLVLPEPLKFSRKDPADIQLLFLKFLMNIQTMNVDLEASEREGETEAEGDRQDDEINRRRNQPDGEGEGDLSDADSQDSQEAADGSDFSSDLAKGKSKNPNSPGGLPKASEFKDGAAKGESQGEPDLKAIDDELKALEVLEERRVARAELKKEDTEYDPEIPDPPEEIRSVFMAKKSPTEKLAELLDKAASQSNISAPDMRKIQKILAEQPNTKEPFGSGKTLKEMTTITEEDLKFDEKKLTFPSDERVLDKSMMSSTVEALDRDYIKKLMKKDVVSAIMSVQKAGVLVSDIQHETVHSALGAFESFSVTLKPLNGRSSVVRFKYPKVQEDGTFTANGVRYHMRKQRVDLPIRKTAPDKVCISSYYRKMFISRSPKKARNGLSVIVDKLTQASIGNVDFISSVRPADVYDNKFKAPFIYNAIAGYYKSFTVTHELFGEFFLDFEHRKRFELFDEKTISMLEKDGAVVVGKTKKGRPIFVAMDGQFFTHTENGPQLMGDIYDLLKIDRLEVPVDPAEVKIMGVSVPVGLILARSMGLKKLLKMTGAKYRLVKGRQLKNLQPFEYAVNFEDYSLIFDRRDVKNSLIFGGFTHGSKMFKAFPIRAYERKDVYDDLLVSMGGSVVLCRELDLLENAFVDSVTETILEKMGEPTTFLGLLDRSCELLKDYNHPETQDLEVQQIRGYERFAGFVYKQLMGSIRNFNNRNISGRSRIEMSSYAVWQFLMEDRSVKTCEDINPIQNLKMHESVTFAGEGGRSKDTFLKDSRAMSENDAGVFSEASVDSADVGYNIFLSSSPKLSDLRGLRPKGDLGTDPASYQSPSLMLAVGSGHDD